MMISHSKSEALTPSQRKKVAEAVTCQPCDVQSGKYKNGKEYVFIWVGGVLDPCSKGWDPNDRHYRALVSKIAGLIEAHKKVVHENYDEYSNRGVYWVHELQARLCSAIATNSTHDLESLAYELLEAE